MDRKRRAALRRGVLVTLAAVGVLAANVLSAPPAAAIPGLVKSVFTSPLSMNNKTVSTACPAGTVAVGGGGFLNNVADGQVHLTRAEPRADGGGFIVTAEQDQTGYPVNWSLTAIAICAPAPAGLEYRTVTSPAADVSATMTVTCPAGKNVLGVGARITNGKGQVILQQMAPNAGLTSVTARAHEDEDGYPEQWTLTSVAVCVPAPAGLALATVVSPFNSATPKIITVSCPAGRFIHGGAFMINNGVGEVTPHAIDVTASTAARFRADEDETGYLPSWSLRGFLICAF